MPARNITLRYITDGSLDSKYEERKKLWIELARLKLAEAKAAEDAKAKDIADAGKKIAKGDAKTQ